MSNILTLNTFTVSITESQLREVLKKTVEQSNPGFTVKKVNIHVSAGYSDPREYQPPSVTKVEIELTRETPNPYGR